jgi:CheY-like chemotaxis protein
MSEGAEMQTEQRGPRILVVDDDDALLRVHARALANKGYQVETAPDGAAAARATTTGRASL